MGTGIRNMSVVVSPLVHNRTQILDHFPKFQKACPEPVEGPSPTDSSFFFMVLNRRTSGRALYLLVVALLAVGCQKKVPGNDTTATEIMVFAAASLRDATSELGERFLAHNEGFQLFFNYAGPTDHTTLQCLLQRSAAATCPHWHATCPPLWRCEYCPCPPPPKE